MIGVYEQNVEGYRCFDKNRVRFLKGGGMELKMLQSKSDA